METKIKFLLILFGVTLGQLKSLGRKHRFHHLRKIGGITTKL